MEAGAIAIRAKSPRVEDAFELFQLEKRGDRASQMTLDFYELLVGKFLCLGHPWRRGAYEAEGEGSAAVRRPHVAASSARGLGHDHLACIAAITS